MMFNLLKERLSRKYLNLIGVASPMEVEKAENIFYINYLQEGMIVFDVGANIGELSLLFSHFVGSKGQVHSFEASKNTFEKLFQICQIANRSQIIVNHKAVTEKTDIIKLYIYDEAHSSWNSIADRPLENYGIDLKPEYVEEVESITIDEYCQEHNIDHIDLLKIDVEGAEYKVLQGAKNMLKSQKIRCCIFEFGQTTFDIGNTPKEIDIYLQKLGYKIKNIVKGDPKFPGGSSVANACFSIHIARPE